MAASARKAGVRTIENMTKRAGGDKLRVNQPYDQLISDAERSGFDKATKALDMGVIGVAAGSYCN